MTAKKVEAAVTPEPVANTVPYVIKLGHRLRDACSGFSGIAIQKIETLNGNVQYAIQPQQKPDDDKYPEGMCIDHHMLEYIDEGVVDRVTPVITTSPIELGDMVEDVATGFKGVAVERATYMNGCFSYAVLPKAVKTDILNDNSRASWVDHARLKKCATGGIQHKLPEPAVYAPTGKSPGGPARKMMSRG
jgi:hypothetical protein